MATGLEVRPGGMGEVAVPDKTREPTTPQSNPVPEVTNPAREEGKSEGEKEVEEEEEEKG